MNIFVSTYLQQTIQVYTLEDSVPIYISEVNYAGSTNSLGCKASDSTSKVTCANDKWVEIHNTSDKNLDIQGFTVGVGKRTTDPSAFASTFNITTSLIIPANGFIVLLNKDSGLESTLKQGKFQYASVGSLFGISNNTLGKKYIRVAIIKNGQTLSEVNIPNLDSLEKSNNIRQSESQKISLNFDEKHKPTFSSAEYFPNNYGSPGLPFLTQKTVEKETNKTVNQVVVPSPIPAKTDPDSIKLNIPEAVNAVVSIPQNIPVPVMKTIPQGTPVEVKKISNITLSESLAAEKSSLIKERNTVEIKEQVSVSVPTTYKKMIEITSSNNLNSQVILATKFEKVKPDIHIISKYENTNLQFNSVSEISGLNSIPNLGLFNLVSALAVACEILFTKINKNEYFANKFFLKKWLVCKRDSV